MKDLPTWRTVLDRMNSGTHNAVDRFLFHNEPAEPEDVVFRAQLTEALDEEYQRGVMAERQRIGESVQTIFDNPRTYGFENSTPAALQRIMDVIANEETEEDDHGREES